MDELNQTNDSVVEETTPAESEKALKCDSNEPKKSKAPALFKAGVALMCATSALSIGAIGACGFLGYKLYKKSKNSNTTPENSMGSVVTNTGEAITITVDDDGYLVVNGVKQDVNISSLNGSNGEDGKDGVSIVSASLVKLDRWGITTQYNFRLSDNSYITTTPQTQVLSEHFYDAESMSEVLTLAQDYNVSKIKLTENIELNTALDFNQDTVIDLNRKTLTYTAQDPLTVANESSLTFKNGSLGIYNDVGVSIEGTDSELAFNKVNISATAVVAETLQDNATIDLENCSFETIQPISRFALRRASVGSLFIVKGSNANLVVKSSKFQTNRAIVAATENAQTINFVAKETKINTTAPILDINTDEVVPTVDIDENTLSTSTITELNTSPITSGSFSIDPTELGAELEGVEQFSVNGSTVLASDFASLVELVEDGSTITLTRDTALETALVVDKKITIDLDDFTISTPEDEIGDGVFHVIAGGDLTINSGEYGTVNGVGRGSYHMAVWVDGGKATINGGTFTNIGATNPDNPNDTQFDLIYVKGGELIINDGFFTSESPKWTINIKDAYKDSSTILVKGGVFEGYNPTASETENPVADFVADGTIAVSDGMFFVVGSPKDFADYASYNEVNYIKLYSDVEVPTAIVVDRDLTIDLGNYTISIPNDTVGDGVFHVVPGGNLTIDSDELGTINGVGKSKWHMAIWVEGGNATINGGTFTNVGAVNPENADDKQFDLMYVKGGSLVINGGTFIAETPKWTLNLKDNLPGSITINGGSFYGYNPTESKTENPVANFVDDTHFVYSDGEYYSVAPVSDIADIINTDGVNYLELNSNTEIETALVFDKTFTINLKNYIISAPNDTAGDGIFHVIKGGHLIINADDDAVVYGVGKSVYCMAVWADGGKITINGGTYTNVEAGSDDQYDLIYASNGGEIIINNGWFLCQTPKWTLNLKDNSNSSIVVNGGYFFEYNPAESKTENPAADFVADGTFIASDGETYVVASSKEFLDYIEFEEVNYIKLYSDIEVPTTIVVDRDLTIDLGNHTISAPNFDGYALFKVDTNGKLTINGNGTINSASSVSDGSSALWARNGGEIIINGGTFTNVGAKDFETDEFGQPTTIPNNNELLYMSGEGSKITINAGTFIGNYENETYHQTFTLNKYDGHRAICTFDVRGGSFYGFNPANNLAEGKGTNFVADGYFVYSVGDYFTVAPVSQLAEVMKENKGASIMLTSTIIVEDELTLDLNDCTITAPYFDGYALFKVDTNGKLTINGNGTINSASSVSDGSSALWARNGGEIIINGGTFTNVGAKDFETDENGQPTTTPNNNELLYMSGEGSKITINAGTFIGNYENETYHQTFTLNKYDGHRAICTFDVRGGSFYGFNPADNLAEGNGTNFVANGYTVVANGDYYVVIEETVAE